MDLQPALTGLRRAARLGYDPALANSPEYVFVQRRLAAWVGIVALLLPLTLWFLGRGTCFRETVSDYYYDTMAGNAFVVALGSIATILFVYRGRYWFENWLATAASAAALGVAVFPTDGPGCDYEVDQGGRMLGRVSEVAADGTLTYVYRDENKALWTTFSGVEKWHLYSAGLLFVILAVFCLLVFTIASDRHRDASGRLKRDKVARNGVYVAMGLVIVGALIALVTTFAGDEAAARGWTLLGMPAVFALESLALVAFGIAWLVRGRFLFWARD